MRIRRCAASAFGIGAGLLALASASFACTNFMGKASFSGDVSGTGTSTVVGANTPGMNYCSTSTEPVSPGTNVTSGRSKGSLAVSITVPATTSAECNANSANVMPNGTYSMGTAGPVPGGWPSSPVVFPTGTYDACGTHGGGSVYTFGGSLTVTSGAGSHTFSAGNGNGNYWDATGVWTVCIYNTQAPAIGTFITVV